MRGSIEKQLTRRKKSAMPASCPWFSENTAKHNSAFIMRAARETDSNKFRVILNSHKVAARVVSVTFMSRDCH